MKHIQHVYSNGIPNAIEILNDQVYIPQNIHEFEQETLDGIITGYEYDCDIYSKDEYIVLMSQQTSRITELEDELAAAKILLGVDE